MKRRPIKPSSHCETSTTNDKACPDQRIPKRPATLWLSLFILFLNGSWAVYHFQFERLPMPLNADQAGKRGFSEVLAMEHVKALTSLGPHPVGSDALDHALQYVLAASEQIKKTAHWEVDVQVDFFHSKPAANLLVGGMFRGKTLVYSDMKHIALRILPKYLPEAEENVILVSSHIDTVFSTEGAGDCSSCVAVMLELARGVSQWAHGFKTGVIFLFNTGEEEGLNGAHSFITQHPWRHSVRFFVDLEAMGIGGKSSIFQSGSAPWAIERFARVAKYPAAQIISQDLFLSGVIKSATDFQVYNEIGGLPGLDFAYTDTSAVYHTKNDKVKLLKPGSLQHLGENMLPFLLQISMSSYLTKKEAIQGTGQEQAVFFDILGKYMIVYRQHFASMLQNSVILQALLICTTSLLMGGYPAMVALGLSFMGVILMWIFSLSLAIGVAFLLPYTCLYPAPYIANPWLVFGLFGAPAVVGAIFGQHLGFQILHKYLCHVASKRNPGSVVQVNLIKLEAERWFYKAGAIQWLIVLILGNYFHAGSSYIALVWLISPAFAYGLIEATLTPARSPKQLRIITLLLGLTPPTLISGGVFIRLVGVITGVMVRIEGNPGSKPDWLGSLIVAIYIALVVCLTLVYLLSYIHLSGAKKPVIISMCVLFGLTLTAISTGVFPMFTNDIARAINVVHVVDTTGTYGKNLDPVSYVSIFSTTPGKLTNEVDNMKDEEFSCGRDQTLDLVTFRVHYGCWSLKDSMDGWSKSDIPILHIESDSVENDIRKTKIFVDTRISTRWTLAINSEHVEHFTFKGNSEDFLSVDNNSTGDGWHIIQFSGGKNSPTKFTLTLSWSKNTTHSSQRIHKQGDSNLLKLRTDVNRITPKTARVLDKLPSWCSLFGKSTYPYTLAFLTSLPIEF